MSTYTTTRRLTHDICAQCAGFDDDRFCTGVCRERRSPNYGKQLHFDRRACDFFVRKAAEDKETEE